MGVFQAKGWWPKSSCPPSKVYLLCVSKRGIWDVPGILPGCPGPLRVFQKVCAERVCAHFSFPKIDSSLITEEISSCSLFMRTQNKQGQNPHKLCKPNRKSRKWLREGAKGVLDPKSKGPPSVSCTFRNLFCTGATLSCTGARGFLLPESKRPFAPSRNHFREFPIFDPFSQAAWFPTQTSSCRKCLQALDSSRQL